MSSSQERIRGRATLPDGALPVGVTQDRRTSSDLSSRDHTASGAPDRGVDALIVVGSDADALCLLPIAHALDDVGESAVDASALEADVRPVVLSGDPTDGAAGSHGRAVATAMQRFDELWESRAGSSGDEPMGSLDAPRPGVVVVHGSDAVALAAAFTAAHHGLPVVQVVTGPLHDTRSDSGCDDPAHGHLDHGLVARIACCHLVPSAAGLAYAGVAPDRAFVCGDLRIDSLRRAATDLVEPSDPAIASIVATRGPLVLVTTDRPGDAGGDIARVAAAVARLAELRPGCRFVVPMPQVAQVRRRIALQLGDRPNVVLTEPLPRSELAHLLQRADLLITDSEAHRTTAPVLATPVLFTTTTADHAAGRGPWKVVGTDADGIVDCASRLMDDTSERRRLLAEPNPCGDGHAGERAAAALAHLFADGPPARSFGPGIDRSAVRAAAGTDRSLDPDRPRRGTTSSSFRFATGAR